MIQEEEEKISYSNESHMDLLSASEEECTMVAQDSPSSDDLDDTTVTFGPQISDKEYFEKVHYEILFEQESSTEEGISHSEQGRTGNETPHATEHPGENIVCKASEKSAFGGQLDEKNNGQKIIKKRSWEDEIFGLTDKNSELQESNLTMHHNPFIVQKMDYNTTIESDETSETSNGDSEKKNSKKFYMQEEYMF